MELHHHFRVFFAPNALAWTWGRSLGQVLPHVYGVDAKYVLVLSTEAYLHKHWTRVEYDAVREGNNGRLLLVDLGARPADFPDDEIYIEGTPAELVRLVARIKTRISDLT